jgi:hypothetical protein
MTLRRNQIAGFVGLSGAFILLGMATARAPQVAFAVAACTVLVAALAWGVQALLVTIIVAFPVIPSNVHLAASTSVYPQRGLVVVLLLALVADGPAWTANMWRLGRVGHSLRLFAAFLAVGLVSGVVSPYPRIALLGVLFYGAQLGGMLIAGIVLADTRRDRTYLNAISAGVIGVTILAVAQYLHPSLLHNLLGPTQISNPTDVSAVRALPRRVSGPLPDPVSLGAYVALVLPFLLRAASTRDGGCARLGKVALVLALIDLMLSQTRSAMLAVPVVLLVWLIASDERAQVVRLAVLAGATLTIVFGVSVLTTQGSILGTILAYRGQANGMTTASQNIAGRRSLYITALKALEQRPVVGYGMRVPTQQAQSSVFTSIGEPYAFESYLVVLPLEVGIAGTVVFVTFILTLLREAARRFERRGDRATLYAAVAGATMLSLGTNAFDIEVTYWWLLLGLLIGSALTPKGRSSNLKVVRQPGARKVAGRNWVGARIEMGS